MILLLAIISDTTMTYTMIALIIGVILFIVGSIIKKSIIKLFSVLVILVAGWFLLSQFFDLI